MKALPCGDDPLGSGASHFISCRWKVIERNRIRWLDGEHEFKNPKMLADFKGEYRV